MHHTQDLDSRVIWCDVIFWFVFVSTYFLRFASNSRFENLPWALCDG